MLKGNHSGTIIKRHITVGSADRTIQRYGKGEFLFGITGISGYSLGDHQIAACYCPLAIQNGIRIQNRTVRIQKRTLFIRVPAIKNIALMSVLLYLRRIGRSVTDIVIRRGCYIGRIICAHPLILDLDSRHIGHPVGLSCLLALPNDQILRYFPARYENTVLIGRLCRSFTACVRRITNKLRTNFGILYRAILAVDLNRFRSACARIRRDYIDIPPFLGNTAALYQVDIIVRADHSIISQIESSTYINTVTFGCTSICLSQGVVVVLDNASCHGIGTTADATAYICNIVFNGTVGLFNRGCGPQVYATTLRGLVFGNRTAGNRYIRCIIQENTATIILSAISR